MPRPIGHRPPAAAPGLLDPVMLAPPVLDHRGIAPVADDVGYLPVGEALVDAGLDPSPVGELGVWSWPGRPHPSTSRGYAPEEYRQYQIAAAVLFFSNWFQSDIWRM